MNTNVEIVKSKVIDAQNVYWTFSDGHLKDDIALVDTVDIIEALEWCDDEESIIYDECFEKLELVLADNTYNFNGNVSSNINWETAKTVDGYVTRVMFHLGGDIRGNYTEYLYFEHDSEDDFLMALDDVNGNVVVKTVDGVDVYFSPRALSERVDIWIPEYDFAIDWFDFEITDDVAESMLLTALKG